MIETKFSGNCFVYADNIEFFSSICINWWLPEVKVKKGKWRQGNCVAKGQIWILILYRLSSCLDTSSLEANRLLEVKKV